MPFAHRDFRIAWIVLGYVVGATAWIFFSDRLLAQIGDVSTMVELSTYKGLFFVAITASLLYFALRHVPNETTRSNDRAAGFAWGPLVAVAATAAMVAVIAHVSYRGEAEAMRREMLRRMEAIAGLEARSITRWLEERRGDIEVLARDPARRAEIAGVLTGSSEARRSLEVAFRSVRDQFGISGVVLIGANGEPIAGDLESVCVKPTFRDAVARASAGETTFIDMFRRPDGSIHLGFAAPVFTRGASNGRPDAVIVFDMTPEAQLHPILEGWPLPSHSGENILNRIENGEIVRLWDPGSRGATFPDERHTIAGSNRPAARWATLGERSMLATDRRGIPVLAAAEQEPVSGWLLVAKMDEEEALSGLHHLAMATAIAFLVAFAGILGGAVFVWQRGRMRSALSELAQRQLTRSAEDRYRATFEEVSVGIAHVGLDGRWLRFNRAFKAISGYSAEELGSMPLIAIFHPDERAPVMESLRLLQSGQLSQIASERRIYRASGDIALVAITATLVQEANGTRYIIGTAEDITARRAAEEALKASEERFELAMRGANDGLWDWNVEKGEIYLSPRWKTMLGWEADELSDRFSTWEGLLHPEDATRVKAETRAVFQGHADSWTCEVRMRTKSGEWRDILSRAFVVRDASGRSVRMVGTHVDITERKRDVAELKRAAAVFTNTQEGVVITDPQGTIVTVNPAFSAITGWSREEVVGRGIALLKSGRHDETFYRAMWEAIESDGHWQGEIWNRRKSGEHYPELLSIATVRDDAGRVIARVGTFVDISGIKASEERLTHLALHDPLTGLANRVLFHEELERAIEATVGHGGSGAVLFLDLDRFKTINDSLGHACGDELLYLVSQRLKSRLPEGALLARVGGDEFVGMIPDLSNDRAAAVLAGDWLGLLDEGFMLSGGRELFVSASIGIAVFPRDGLVAEDLLQASDAALYVAKGAGGSTHRLYKPEMRLAVSERLEIEVGLRRALERHELELHYQPLVAPDTGRIKGVEALVRWRDPMRGLIGPDKFIPIAEDTGLIIPIGDWVLSEACRQMRIWRDAGLDIETMAVNLSAREFLRSDVISRIAEVLEQTGLPARHLELEITEGALMEQGRDADRRLAMLKALGVRLAIDDFGTGYSSLAYLRRLPIDKLKIDRSFIAEMPEDATSVEITGTVVSLARTLGLEVLAEGVETKAQLDVLIGLGCDTVQGWYFSKPVEPTKIEAMLSGGDDDGRRMPVAGFGA